MLLVILHAVLGSANNNQRLELFKKTEIENEISHGWQNKSRTAKCPKPLIGLADCPHPCCMYFHLYVSGKVGFITLQTSKFTKWYFIEHFITFKINNRIILFTVQLLKLVSIVVPLWHRTIHRHSHLVRLSLADQRLI